MIVNDEMILSTVCRLKQYAKIYFWFLDKNTRMFTFSGVKLFPRGVTTLSDELNSHSDGQLVADIDKYFLAIIAKSG